MPFALGLWTCSILVSFDGPNVSRESLKTRKVQRPLWSASCRWSYRLLSLEAFKAATIYARHQGWPWRPRYWIDFEVLLTTENNANGLLDPH